MDVKGVSNRSVEMTQPTGEKTPHVKNRETEFPAMDTVSSLPKDWKVKIKNIDLEIQDLQEQITVHQLKREGLANLQMELMDIGDSDTAKAAELVRKTVASTTYNNTGILSEFELKDGVSFYEYLSGLETEKNRLLDSISKDSRTIKSKMIEKENILFASNNIDPEEMRSQRMADINQILSSAAKNLRSDNSYIARILDI